MIQNGNYSARGSDAAEEKVKQTKMIVFRYVRFRALTFGAAFEENARFSVRDFSHTVRFLAQRLSGPTSIGFTKTLTPPSCSIIFLTRALPSTRAGISP
jgi:hypothetical protein